MPSALKLSALSAHNSILLYCSMVGARRFELPTPCAQGRCATRLRYAPSMTEAILHAKPMKSRFCVQINQTWQGLGQSRQRFAAMTHRGFDSELYLAKSFIEWWIKK